MAESLRILFIAAEVAPFAKTGGLGDVTGALPKALAALGHDVRVVMPLYQTVRDGNFAREEVLTDVTVPLVTGMRTARVWQGALPDLDASTPQVPVYFIEQDDFFARPGLYGDDNGDYPDNALRFIFFCRAALALAVRLGELPNVLHCHDWQTALIPAYLRALPWLDARLSSAALVYTVHNLAYQGIFPAWAFQLTGLPAVLFQPAGVEFFGLTNFMKAGLQYADVLTTVSPTYAEEICTQELGAGLNSVLQTRRNALVGILNGVDYSIWSPDVDAHIAARYDTHDIAGKAECKKALLRMFHFPEDVDVPLIGMISRLVDQKGFDLLAAALDQLLALNLRLVILGAGAEPYEELLSSLSRRYPQKIAVRVGFDDVLAHQIEAGSDCFLMPSRYEPCGLNQIYSLRYGAIPIVRATGGLKDTVLPFNAATGEGTGFVFQDASGAALFTAVNEAVTAFADQIAWRQLMRNAMAQDFSWRESATRYVALYERAVASQRRP